MTSVRTADYSVTKVGAISELWWKVATWILAEIKVWWASWCNLLSLKSYKNWLKAAPNHALCYIFISILVIDIYCLYIQHILTAAWWMTAQDWQLQQEHSMRSWAMSCSPWRAQLWYWIRKLTWEQIDIFHNLKSNSDQSFLGDKSTRKPLCLTRHLYRIARPQETLGRWYAVLPVGAWPRWPNSVSKLAKLPKADFQNCPNAKEEDQSRDNQTLRKSKKSFGQISWKSPIGGFWPQAGPFFSSWKDSCLRSLRNRDRVSPVLAVGASQP